jgi:hypothetical protein
MDASNIAEWQTSHPTTFLAWSITLPTRTVRLTSGGTVTFGGNTYVPEDDDIGVLSRVETLNDGGSRAAQLPEIEVKPFTDAGVSELGALAAQGSSWTLYRGLVNPDTGAVIGTPDTKISGFLNSVEISVSPGQRTVTISSYSDEQFLLLDNAHQRLSDSFHKQIWSGETGLANVSRVARDIYWRANEPPRNVNRGGGGGGGNLPGNRFLV